MIVVSDTSPINYLVLIELQDLLPKLLDRILIPEAVHRELQSAAAPDPIKRFLAEAPDWLEVRPSPEIDPAPRQLDSGEREVITLALSTKADSVLLDERKGRGWLFLTSTPETRTRLVPLTSLWLDTLVLRLMNPGRKSDRAVWFVLDELASLQRLPQL